jgi:putative two-component system response regulator
LAAAAEFRDEDTAAHLRRISGYSVVLGRRLGMSMEDVGLLEQASPMHDIGKIGVPDSILLKPGRLTTKEFEVVKGHSEMGAKILSNPSSSLLQMAQTVARWHHERWDGSGYPYGLQGDDIPLVARIVALADVFDALACKRCYKDAISLEDAFKIIRNQSGKHFDPTVVEAFLAAAEEMRAIYEGTRSQQP